jgi:nitrogen fixation protein NifQ
MTRYTDTIRRWAADNRRAGMLTDADGIGEVGLGDGEAGRRLAVRFTLRLRGDRAETVRYQVFGCGFTIAACAAAAELAEGRPLGEIGSIVPARVDAALGGLPAGRDYCATLAVEALQAAVKSAANGRRPVTTAIVPKEDHTPLISATDPTYRLLVDSPAPRGAPAEDRHLFACLISVTQREPGGAAATTGLSRAELADLLDLYFPEAPREQILAGPVPAAVSSATAPELLNLLLAYLPLDGADRTPVPSRWLTLALATRAARPGHLWRAMGLFDRSELSAAIRRHLPALAAANHRGMRWKRFFYRRLCEENGGTMCKTPDCGLCSDYALCFAGDDQAPLL